MQVIFDKMHLMVNRMFRWIGHNFWLFLVGYISKSFVLKGV